MDNTVHEQTSHSLDIPQIEIPRTWTAFSDYAGSDLLCSTVFSFLVIFSFFFILGRAVDLTASFRAHINIVSLLTYLLYM